MNRIEEIKEKAKNHNEYKHLGYYDERNLPEIFEDVECLLSRLEQAEKALERYANLHKLMYDDAVNGELYEHWWLRQNKHAEDALQLIRS